MYKKRRFCSQGGKKCVIFRKERSDDWKYVCCSQATKPSNNNFFFFKLGASGGESIGDLLTSKDEQEVKKLKLSKDTIFDDQVQGSKEANLPGIPAGPTKVC